MLMNGLTRLRYFSLVALLAVAFMGLGMGRASAQTLLHLDADHIAFYYDRFLVEADGHVRVRTSDGTTIEGDTFTMDLKLNRFMIAGHVSLHDATGNLTGAALADFITFKRVYFIPVTSAPDRWTYLNGDYSHPAKGRIMPGDTFAFPNLSHSRLSLTAHSAVIEAQQFARFSGVTTYFAGIAAPLPSFYVNFSSNVNLAQNSLSGASYDATWNMTGNANSISALHLRYDSINKTYLSFEQHLSGQHEFAVFSVNPLSRPAKFWNLVLQDDIGKKFEIRTFTQMYTYQYGLSEPLAATQTTYAFATLALNHSSLQAYSNFTDYNILGPAQQNNPNFPYPGALNHPTSLQLTWSSFNNQIGKLPLYEQIYSGIGFNHDSLVGLQNYGGVLYTTLWNHLVGFNVYTPSIKIGDHYGSPYKLWYMNATFNKQRQWYSVPHHVDTASTTISFSRQFTRTINAYASENIVNTGDYYIHGGYVPYTPPGDPGYAAFRGVSTQRTLALGINYVPSPEFSATLLARQHTDFPRAVPGIFALPPLNNLGQFTYQNYLGEPPYDITADVRARISPHMLIDISRSYYFNFGNLRWSPQFTVQVTP